MKVKFDSTDRTAILSAIREKMGSRELGKMVDFDISGGTLTVTISKMGKSTLDFAESEVDGTLVYKLSKEKIAFAHKPFKDDVTAKIIDVIKKAGGAVS